MAKYEETKFLSNTYVICLLVETTLMSVQYYQASSQ